MAVRVGVHAERLSAVRALLTAKGRQRSGRFSFEGATLLEEARCSGVNVDEVYVTQEAYDRDRIVAEMERHGVPVFLVEPRSLAKISDVGTPAGIVAVAAVRDAPLDAVFGGDGTVLILADLNDPGNVGTLLRSAEAFGCRGVVAGELGADPYHPKVVRAAMGALFRLPIAVAGPEAMRATAARAGYEIAGLSALGEPLAGYVWPPRSGLVVGHERHGLEAWAGTCDRRLAIPMPGPAESLNAAIAGSIALYEAAKRPPESRS